jgi:hypothetical protein
MSDNSETFDTLRKFQFTEFRGDNRQPLPSVSKQSKFNRQLGGRNRSTGNRARSTPMFVSGLAGLGWLARRKRKICGGLSSTAFRSRGYGRTATLAVFLFAQPQDLLAAI